MNRKEQLNDLVRQAGLSAGELATLLDLPPAEVAGWLEGAVTIPDSIFSFLKTYLKLKSISSGVSCPLPR